MNKQEVNEVEENTNELIYYKFMKAYLWLIDPNTDFIVHNFSMTIVFQEVELELWYGVEMFDYTKETRSFSIFHNNVAVDNVPFIKKIISYIIQLRAKEVNMLLVWKRYQIVLKL